MVTNLCGTRWLGACIVAPWSAAGTAVRTNTLSFQMTGVPDPRPGISIFQRMFFVSLHSSGGSAVRETPVAYGPRHCGQYFSAVGSGLLLDPCSDGEAACSAATRPTQNAAARVCFISYPMRSEYPRCVR